MMQYLSLCLSHLAPQHVVGLLLWALQAGDIDRLLHNASAAGAATFRSISTAARWSATNVSSVMFATT